MNGQLIPEQTVIKILLKHLIHAIELGNLSRLRGLKFHSTGSCHRDQSRALNKQCCLNQSGINLLSREEGVIMSHNPFVPEF